MTAPSFPELTEAEWQAWFPIAAQVQVHLSSAALTQFKTFYRLLAETNRQVNLIRFASAEEWLYRHLLDSLSLLPLIPEGASLADVGSGAGFPAIPLAIARPDVEVTAIELMAKKARFIQTVKEALNLANLTVLTVRSEELAHQAAYRDQFDVVTARAVTALPLLLELCLPLVKVSGRFLAMKGLSYETELSDAQVALKLLQGELVTVHQFSPEALQGARLLEIRKTASTPAGYPRPTRVLLKKPL